MSAPAALGSAPQCHAVFVMHDAGSITAECTPQCVATARRHTYAAEIPKAVLRKECACNCGADDQGPCSWRCTRHSGGRVLGALLAAWCAGTAIAYLLGA